MEFEAVVRQFHQTKKEWRWFNYLSNITPDQHGKAYFLNGIVRDVTEQIRIQTELVDHKKRLEKLVGLKTANLVRTNQDLKQKMENRRKDEIRLKSTLREKEFFRKETHHGVKNNLQNIANLLDLESMHCSDEKTLQAFQDCRDRVRAMCMVHRQLYQTGDLSRIPLADYAEDLASQLFKAYGADPAGIHMTINAPEVYLVMDLAIACGLILNEFISNSLKYAFSEQESGILTFEARKLEDQKKKSFFQTTARGSPPALSLKKPKPWDSRLFITWWKNNLQTNWSISKDLVALTVLLLTTRSRKGK